MSSVLSSKKFINEKDNIMNDNFRKILEFSQKNDIRKIGYRETARRLNIKSPQTVIYYLKKVENQGWLYYDPKTKTKKSAKNKAFAVDNFFNIPVLGSANCGPALELAQEKIQGFIKISQKSVGVVSPNNLIAIKAVGDSLNKADIKGDNVESGDYLIVDCGKKSPDNGDYVLSIIDGAANFKKFYKDDKKNEIRLVSESSLDIPPIVLHEEDINPPGYEVNGVVLRVVKN